MGRGAYARRGREPCRSGPWHPDSGWGPGRPPLGLGGRAKPGPLVAVQQVPARHAAESRRGIVLASCDRRSAGRRSSGGGLAEPAVPPQRTSGLAARWPRGVVQGRARRRRSDCEARETSPPAQGFVAGDIPRDGEEEWGNEGGCAPCLAPSPSVDGASYEVFWRRIHFMYVKSIERRVFRGTKVLSGEKGLPSNPTLNPTRRRPCVLPPRPGALFLYDYMAHACAHSRQGWSRRREERLDLETLHPHLKIRMGRYLARGVPLVTEVSRHGRSSARWRCGRVLKTSSAVSEFDKCPKGVPPPGPPPGRRALRTLMAPGDRYEQHTKMVYQ